jgi:hypothetical protein
MQGGGVPYPRLLLKFINYREIRYKIRLILSVILFGLSDTFIAIVMTAEIYLNEAGK